MKIEAVLFVVLFLASLVPVLAAWRNRGGQRFLVVGVLGLWALFPVVVVVTALNFKHPVVATDEVSYRPIEEKSDGYVGSMTCRSCHPHNHATWYASYHRTMTQVATEQTVLGKFDDVELEVVDSEANDLRLRLSRRGDEFWADMDLPARPGSSGIARRIGRPVVLTTGSHHYQAYWYKIGNNTRILGMLPFVYLLEEQRWIPRDAAFLRPHESSPSDESGRWNHTCIRCHATHGRARAMEFDASGTNFKIESVDSKVVEFGISCEACHGPGERHVDANRNPFHRYQQHLGSEPDPTIVNPARLSHQQASQICGQCHGIFEFHGKEDYHNWIQHGYEFRPGEDLAASGMRYLVRCDLRPMPASLQERLTKSPDHLEGLFWSDGIVRVSGREYNGLVHTPCFTRGTMSCLSCHSMHQAKGDPRPRKAWSNDQLKAGLETNRACTQCHEAFLDEEAVTQHTHHLSKSSGSLCYNCHMPYTTYGLLKAIRSHTIDSPSVAVSQKTGRPNACNQCHLDKTLDWSAQNLSKWYGQERAELSDDERSTAASLLWLLRGDAGQRALMAWSYGWDSAREASGTEWMAPFLGQLFDDPYDAVRLIAERSFRRQPVSGQIHYDFLSPTHERQAVKQLVIENWQQQYMDAEKPEMRQLLIGPGGTLMLEKMHRLIGERDDRQVDLRE